MQTMSKATILGIRPVGIIAHALYGVGLRQNSLIGKLLWSIYRAVKCIPSKSDDCTLNHNSLSEIVLTEVSPVADFIAKSTRMEVTGDIIYIGSITPASLENITNVISEIIYGKPNQNPFNSSSPQIKVIIPKYKMQKVFHQDLYGGMKSLLEYFKTKPGATMNDIMNSSSIIVNGVAHKRMSSKSSSIFYFGITVARRKHIMLSHAAQSTWGKYAQVTWYSTESDAFLNATVVRVGQGDGYGLVTHRVRAIWAHVYKYHTGYDWYLRCWDDNFLILSRISLIADQLDPYVSVIIGRLGIYKDGGGVDITFVEGGASSLMSKAALDQWAKFSGLDFQCSFANMKCASWCEDVAFSKCQHDAGIPFVPAYGFHAQSFRHQEVNLLPSALEHGLTAAEFKNDRSGYFGDKQTKTLHYVSVNDMLELSAAFYPEL